MLFRRLLTLLLVIVIFPISLIALLYAWMIQRLWGRISLPSRPFSRAGEKPKDVSAAFRICDEKIRSLETEIAKRDEKSQSMKAAHETASNRWRAQLEKAEHRVIELETMLRDGQFDLLDENEKVGLYEPHYDFESSEKYKKHLDKVRDSQKRLVRLKKAVSVGSEWTVEGSRAKGKAITDDMQKLMLRAFNGESDALIAKVKHNNISSFETRLEKSFVAINRMAARFTCAIEFAYLELKIDELRVVHEFAEQKSFEREEQRRIREELREEQRALKEAEKAKREAEQEAKRFSEALKKAEEQVSSAQGEELVALQAKIEALRLELEEAEQKGARAISQAQLTRSGHVYIISNIGSFGETIYKIGMTRRLEPLDRIKELGDASVPYPFDLHAMIYSEDAPGLEAHLHRFFRFRRVNMANHRKEFFQVTLDEVIAALPQDISEVAFIADSEAREYRESMELHRLIEAGEMPEVFLKAEERLYSSPDYTSDDDPKEIDLQSA